MRELLFLPDRDGRDVTPEQTGFVRIGADVSALIDLAARLAVPERADVSHDDPAWRGVLALALLADVWVDCDARLTVLTVDGSTSPFAAWVLAARPAQERGKPVRLLVLERGGERRLLGLADRRQALRLPATPVSLAVVAPEDAAWIDRESGLVSDPIPYLTERDRVILLERMALLELDAPCAVGFMAALRQADQAETDAVRADDEAALERLRLRMEAVQGLAGFDAFSVQTKRYGQMGCNPLMQCFTHKDAPLHQELGESCTYLWHGMPFACTSSELGLTGVHSVGTDEALGQIRQELDMMTGGSVSWCYRTGTALQRWLDARRQDDALAPQARACLQDAARRLLDEGRQVQTVVTLTWPWDAASGAVRALLQETLGDGWLAGAAAPFADRLARLPGHVLGDTALQACCAQEDGVLLPPLSREMAACVAGAEEGAGLALDALRFQAQEDGGITASFLLRGKGELRLIRHYAADEIVMLDAADAPCLAVWPCLPLEGWRAYHVFTRGGVEVAALNEGQWQSSLAGLAEPSAWRCLRTADYPACLSLSLDGQCIGAVPNLLPARRRAAEKDVVAAIDLGSRQTTVAYAANGEVTAMACQELTRLLISRPGQAADPLLDSLTPVGIQPSAVRITGPGDELFTDGHICRITGLPEMQQLDAECLRGLLKWRSDAESVRARRILMHQVMQGAALTAVLGGARSIAWRVGIADEMGDEGREELLAMMKELAARVAEESGLPLTAGQKAVTWAEESAALCTYLRSEGSGRGSYVSVDLGGGSTKLHMWVQGQARPVAGAVILEGVQTALTSVYAAWPQRLLDDFADCGNEMLLQDVLALSACLQGGMTTPRQMDKLGMMLDSLLVRQRPAIVQHMNARFAAQRPTFLQAALLETEAAILFVTGLMLAQTGDNVMINHRLPEDITVCLSGRGAWLLETLTPAMRNSLQYLTHMPMHLDHPVRFVTLRACSRPTEGVARGLAVMRETERLSTPALIRTRQSFSLLMQRLMQQLQSAFPMHVWTLHEGLFDWQGNLTPAGMDTIRRVATRCYGDGEDIPAAVMTFVRMLRETPILPDYASGDA